MKPTLKKILWFIGIITVGLIGLIIADQYDFLNGRTAESNGIGNGIPDPLVINESEPVKPIKETPKPKSVSKPKKTNSGQAEVSAIDGVKNIKK